MKKQGPLDKVVFIQKVATFSSRSLPDLIQLAYVNQSWADTIHNYAFHLFEERFCAKSSVTHHVKALWCALKCDAFWFLKVLLSSNSFFIKSNVGNDCLLIIVCQNSPSLSTMKFVLDKIVEVGGSKFLQAQLSTVNDEHRNALMLLCRSSSPCSSVIKLIMDKTIAICGPEMVKTQLTAIEIFGMNCLMILCSSSSSSPETANVLLERIVSLGGLELLRTQLSATDDDGCNCLLLASQNSCVQIQMLKILLDKIVEVGGPPLLRSALGARDNFGRNCLSLIGTNAWYDFPCSPKENVVKLIASELYHLHLFEQQYFGLTVNERFAVRVRYGIDDSSWTPDPETNAAVTAMLRVVHNFLCLLAALLHCCLLILYFLVVMMCLEFSFFLLLSVLKLLC